MNEHPDHRNRDDEDAVLCPTCNAQVDAFGHDPRCPDVPYWPNPLKAKEA